MAEIVYANHTADHLPGDCVVVSDEEARRLIDAGMARQATKDDAVAVVEATVEDQKDADDKGAKTAAKK